MNYKIIYNLGDKLEDKIRVFLSHYPIIYAFLGGVGIVIFWRGVWHTADYLMAYFFTVSDSVTTTSFSELPWWDGPLSILIGSVLLLLVGLFVTSFIGNEIIISGLKRTKKIVEKNEAEVMLESNEDIKIRQEIHGIDQRLKRLEKKIK